MRKLLFFSMLLSVLGIGALYAFGERDVWVYEDFSSGTFPPTGWTISSNAANWSVFAGANAGGTTPELRLNWTPQFNGTTYFISPAYDTSGQTTMYLDFKHFVDWYASPMTVGVATRSSATAAWNNVWTVSPTDNVGPLTQSIMINNTDVGSSTFQFALFFSGSSYNIDYWYIDDIKLYTPYPNDLAISSFDMPVHIEAGTSLIPTCVVKNAGYNDLTAMVSLYIFIGDVTQAEYPDYYSAMLSFGQTQTVTFPAFTPAQSDQIYSFVFNVTSLENVVDDDTDNNLLEADVNTWTGEKQMVVLEIATGGWCQYCPGAAMAAEDFIDGGYNVAVIENHNGDPYATDLTNGRNAYYGVSGYPTGFFDGVLNYVGGNHTTSVFPSYLPLYEQRNAVKTPCNVYINGVENRENYDLTITLDKLAPISYHNTVMHVALTESGIVYAWQGQDHFSFVDRNMYPGLDGTEWDMANSAMGQVLYNISIVKDPSWVTANCELVVFFQNLDTKEIIQGNKVALTELLPVANDDPGSSPIVTSLGRISPNPFAERATIAYSLKDNAPVSISVFNIKGQLVTNLVHDAKNSGSYTVTWNGRDMNGDAVANGAYIVKMQSGSVTSTRKVMLVK